MAPQPRLKVNKTFTYRGVTKTWSNTYYFSGGTPAGSTPWTTFSDAVVTAEKAIWPTGFVTIVGTVGYAAGSNVPVFTKTYATASTGSFASWVQAPGDCAAVARFTTTQRTSKNHPIYLFSYWHAVGYASASPVDNLNGAQLTAMQTYAAHWVTGFSDGTNTYIKAGPNGAVAQGSSVLTTIRHRDFRN